MVLRVWVFVCLVTVGSWVTTFYWVQAAGHPHTQGLALGEGITLYQPFAWVVWMKDLPPHHLETEKNTAFSIFMFSMMGALGAVFVLQKIQGGGGPSRTMYGSARWAQEAELKQAGLLEGAGVIVGQTHRARLVHGIDAQGKTHWTQSRQGTLMAHNGPEHVFVFAPTRSGKGVGIVVPTLLTWPDSAIIYDIKKENWDITAGRRAQFSHCLRFEPTSSDSIRYNPLLEIRKGDHEVRDAQNIANILIDPEGSKENYDHWEKTSHSLLVGTMLHVLYAEADKSLAGVVDFLANQDRTTEDSLQLMLHHPHRDGQPHPVIASVARESLNKSQKELSSVISTALSFLGLYRDPIVARNTRTSDFAITDMMQAQKPISLYLVVPPSEMERTKPLMRLMLNQIGRRLTESMGHDAASRPKHRLLMMLDEFPSLGRLDFFESQLAYMAGYGIKCCLIAQSLNQIEKIYKPNNSILDNCHIRVTYGALDERTARRISDLLGTKTETFEAQSRHLAGTLLGESRRSVSEHHTARPLLTPGEILQLPPDEALIMAGGLPPYRGKKVMYFLDDRFAPAAHLMAPKSRRQLEKQLPHMQPLSNAWT